MVAAKPSEVWKTCFLAFPENLLSGYSRKHFSMTINIGVGGQASSTQKCKCGCIMYQDKEKVYISKKFFASWCYSRRRDFTYSSGASCHQEILGQFRRILTQSPSCVLPWCRQPVFLAYLDHIESLSSCKVVLAWLHLGQSHISSNTIGYSRNAEITFCMQFLDNLLYT